MIDFDDDTAMIVVVGLLLVIGIYFLDNYSKSAQCASVSARMGMHHEYSITTGCMIEYSDGKWIPIDQYRVEKE